MDDEVINREIKKIQNSRLNRENLYDLILLIEKKIQEISEIEDLKLFSSIIKELNLTEEDEKDLISLRNKVVHDFIKEEEIKLKQEWIYHKIIPAILGYQKEEIIQDSQNIEELMLQELTSFGANLGFEITNKVLIPIKFGRSTYIADLIFKKDDHQVIFEIKGKKTDDLIELGIQQLKTILNANQSEIGVLVVPGSEYDYFGGYDYQILVFGIESDYKILEDWILPKWQYLTYEETNKLLKNLKKLYSKNKEDIELGLKIAQINLSMANWDSAINTLEAIKNSELFNSISNQKKSEIFKNLGIAKCKKADPEKDIKNYEDGQKDLLEAIELNPYDTDAIAGLGGTFKKISKHYEAYKWYKKALEVDPNEPYVLINYLLYELLNSDSVEKIIEEHRASIQGAIKFRSKQIKVLIEVPWAFYDIGMFSLLLGNLELCYQNYLMGIRFSPDTWMIDTTLLTLDKLSHLEKNFPGLNSIRILLLLGMFYHPKLKKYPDESFNERLIFKLENNTNLRKSKEDIKEPLVIIIGGTDESVEKEIQKYREMLIEAFRDFKGTVISGGTKSGISELAGDIKQKYSNNIKLIGYIPSEIPPESHALKDERYDEFRLSNGKDFSILENFQLWYDILRSGCDPIKIKLIGINGGKISGLAFRIAITFGAQVGLVEDSGRSASDLIKDPWWKETVDKGKKQKKHLFNILKNNSGDIHDFLVTPFITDPDIENLRKLIIQDEVGITIYKKDFSNIQMEDDLMTGLLEAKKALPKETGQDQIPILSAKRGTITMNSFSTGDINVFFFIFEEPSKFLEEKITEFTRLLEIELKDEFLALNQIRVYQDENKIAEILSRVFGPEILKFYE